MHLAGANQSTVKCLLHRCSIARRIIAVSERVNHAHLVTWYSATLVIQVRCARGHHGAVQPSHCREEAEYWTISPGASLPMLQGKILSSSRSHFSSSSVSSKSLIAEGPRSTLASSPARRINIPESEAIAVRMRGLGEHEGSHRLQAPHIMSWPNQREERLRETTCCSRRNRCQSCFRQSYHLRCALLGSGDTRALLGACLPCRLLLC